MGLQIFSRFIPFIWERGKVNVFTKNKNNKFHLEKTHENLYRIYPFIKLVWLVGVANWPFPNKSV